MVSLEQLPHPDFLPYPNHYTSAFFRPAKTLKKLSANWRLKASRMKTSMSLKGTRRRCCGCRWDPSYGFRKIHA